MTAFLIRAFLCCLARRFPVKEQANSLPGELYIMVWKILTGLAAACMAVAAIFAYFNSEDLKAERMLQKRAVEDHKKLVARKGEADTAKAAKEDKLKAVTTERDQTKEQVTKATSELQEKEAALQLAKTNLENVGTQLTALENRIKEAGDIEKLIAQVAALKKDQTEAEAAVAHEAQMLAQAQEQLASTQKSIQDRRDYFTRATKGVVESTFTARVATVFPQWNFVLLNKGNSGGVFANADLEVKRGSDVVAKLKVRNVEQNISVADVVGDPAGQLRSGDLVVAAANQSAATSPAAAGGAAPAPGGAAAPAAPTAPAGPNNAVMPGAPAGAGDPFATGGGMGGAAPAPAAPSSDPFGAPAPATPPAGAAPASDPFGTPATPAPATPAGGAPTPGVSDKDPFAPAK
jgi:hypothetical protein